MRDAALLCAAISGAASYVAPTLTVLGVSVLANGLFLYLYFPLYLAEAGAPGRQANPGPRMAIYLLGFAFGGAVGAGILQLTGFPGIAIAIATTGVLGLGRISFQSRS